MVFSGVVANYTTEGTLFVVTADGETVYFNGGDMAWILTAGALVLIMGPGIAFLYSGLLRQKNALSMLFLAMVIYGSAAITWMCLGYSLAFSSTVHSHFIGGLENAGFIGLADAASGKIPALLYAFFQMQFAAVTPVIYAGAFAERSRLAPVILFTICWSILVYSPVACSVWNAGGWLFQLGALDFAGGGPVHTTSSASALAISWYLGKRRGYGSSQVVYRPQNVGFIVLGTSLLLFGWLGFNGGSELAMNLRSLQAAIVTNLAAMTGGFGWLIVDAFWSKKCSAVSFCSGVISGLVGITPASGYVGAPASLAIGFLAAVAANLGTSVMHKTGIDDVLDIFSTHGIAAFIGSMGTAIFAENAYSSLDGYSVGSGWVNHKYITMGYNLAESVFILAWSFTISMILIFLIDHIPYCHFRATAEEEIVGMDLAMMNEKLVDYQLIAAEDVSNMESETAVPSKTNSTEKLPQTPEVV